MRRGGRPGVPPFPVDVTAAQLQQLADQTKKVRAGEVEFGDADWPLFTGPEGHTFCAFGCGHRVHGVRLSGRARARLRSGRAELVLVENPGGAWWAEFQLDTARAAAAASDAAHRTPGRPFVVDVAGPEAAFAADLLSSVTLPCPLAVWLVGGRDVWLYRWEGGWAAPTREMHAAGRYWDRDGLPRATLAGVVADGLLRHAGARAEE